MTDPILDEIAVAIMQAHLPTKAGDPPRKWSACSPEAQAVFRRNASAALAVMKREYDATIALLRSQVTPGRG